MITAWRLVDWFRVNFHSIRLSFNWIMASYPFHSLYVHSQSMHISLTVLERDSIGHEQKYTFIIVKLRANRQKTKDKLGPEIGSVMAWPTTTTTT